MFVIVGGPDGIYFASGPQERGATAVTSEDVQGVLSLEGMIGAQFALALVQPDCF